MAQFSLQFSFIYLANVVTDGTDLDAASSSLRTGRLEVGQVFCTHVSAIKLDYNENVLRTKTVCLRKIS